jgi:hypothetical protein
MFVVVFLSFILTDILLAVRRKRFMQHIRKMRDLLTFAANKEDIPNHFILLSSNVRQV